MKRLLILVLFGCVAWFTIQIAHAQARGEKGAVLLTPSELKWKDAPNIKGLQQAVVWGDSAKGAHGSFAKFAPGTEVPMHSHTATGRSVVVSGTIVSTPQGQPAKELPPGSYFVYPGGAPHITACKAGSECVIYSQWLGAFDLKPVEGAKKN